MTFEALQLLPAIVEAVREQGYEQPTPIQAEAIPAVLAGHDVLAGAQTGTGKTAAFTLPMLHLLATRGEPPKRGQFRPIRALVLTPTRELAAQVEESVKAYGKHLKLKSAVVFGGVGLNPQIEKLVKGVDILVATPGRLLDLADQGHVDLSKVEILVLDEADRMLDMGFIHDVRKVLALLPERKQSLLFSATFSDEIKALAQSLLHDPKHIQVTPPNTTVQRIRQTIYPVARDKKMALLKHLLDGNGWNQVLVFTRTKFGANQVAQFLNEHGITAMALHGNKSQTARTQALEGFKSGQLRVLVATDIAARGIDIEDLPHVINYDIPNVPEDYVHRIGRTGRAGSEGEALSFVSLDEEGWMMAIERFTGQQIPVQALPEFMPGPEEKAEPIAMGRQVLWGGAGKPPSREVMAAAAKAARRELMERMRARKAGANPAPRSAAQGVADDEGGADGDGADTGAGTPAGGERPRIDPEGRRNRNRRRRNKNKAGAGGQPRADGQPGANGGQPRPPRDGRHGQPQGGRKPAGPAPARQPDPLRTGIDALNERGRRNRNRGKGGGGGGIDPLRTSFGRIK
ncbi:DEAD/DEAH box helicase [Tepidimonas taiwanensis]|uniref:DEAD-box ATP-dependent RNA helicase RhpA n=1 Tax=Tepidimonas taiwanensis TaxID=307486 RepID=A0A554X545_9BURK|nr:DEAD/DEAH box helicase [Tepidimonas taiwanensis]MCX7692544.1 DEAD/DEAH box helicase [Tepidimonas taiwanensis]MDM7462962.1 DEAD/DEAH box helicase [Tepidimonas taiwanensis]TSE30959.1 ATP-dependent RNA helicase RhlE [Tepidimonas taiwanensis]UBQ05831.1 DEAD/DEAH box helicase [Tepidimonas taiwanensis]